jgi:predicted  nucleic acid-binding Zn-ribbon protein
VGITGYSRGWYTVNSMSSEQKPNLSVTVDKDKWQQDRDDFCRQAQARLKDMTRKIEDLQAKVTTVETEARDKLVSTIADLRQRQQTLKEEFHKAAATTQEQWQATRTRLARAMEDLEAGFGKAWSHFKDR